PDRTSLTFWSSKSIPNWWRTSWKGVSSRHESVLLFFAPVRTPIAHSRRTIRPGLYHPARAVWWRHGLKATGRVSPTLRRRGTPAGCLLIHRVLGCPNRSSVRQESRGRLVATSTVR